MTDLTHSPAWLKLRECLGRLQNGPWRFVQLRGETPDRWEIDGDDIDLLGTRESVDQLLDAAFRWVRDGDCHLRVCSATPAKVALSLYSLDGKHQVDFDLWIELWQIDNRTRCLRLEDCAPAIVAGADSIQRLLPDVEAAIYIHHLISKRKDLGAAKVGQRLDHYAALTSTAVSRCVAEIQSSRNVPESALQLTRRIIEEKLRLKPASPTRRAFTKLREGLRTLLLAAPRRVSIISLMGCDGSGKTTLANELVSHRTDIEGVLTGKHLYRKSWFYKLLVIFVRPLLFQDRENFDDTFAPVAYIRACIGLRLKLWRRKRGLLLMDRSLPDFLFVGRKTEEPKFCRSRWLMKVIGRRIPTIHFVLPFDLVNRRKQEMTRKGHEIYDSAMFQHFTRLSPVDYSLFNNSSSVTESTSALNNFISKSMR